MLFTYGVKKNDIHRQYVHVSFNGRPTYATDQLYVTFI